MSKKDKPPRIAPKPMEPVTRLVQQLVCKCGKRPILYFTQGVRRPEGGKLITRQFKCDCGARCKQVETRLGPAISSYVDTWTPAPTPAEAAEKAKGKAERVKKKSAR